MNPPKSERFDLFLKRLDLARPADSLNAGLALIARTLNEVEDEMTSIPNNPELWQTDGQRYPPKLDSARSVPNYRYVTRFRSRAHNTFIAENGAIEIQDVADGSVIFQKAGCDGGGVWS